MAGFSLLENMFFVGLLSVVILGAMAALGGVAKVSSGSPGRDAAEREMRRIVTLESIVAKYSDPTEVSINPTPWATSMPLPIGTPIPITISANCERALAHIPASYQPGLARLRSQSKREKAAMSRRLRLRLRCINNDSPCSFYVGQTITVPSQNAPTGAVPCDGSTTNCATNMQEQVISEGRFGLHVHASIYDAGKSLLVTRTKYVTLQTFGVDPYFAVTGERDAAAGDRTAAPRNRLIDVLCVEADRCSPRDLRNLLTCR